MVNATTIAIIETGISRTPRKRAYITQYGKEIDLPKTLDELKAGQSFVLDTAKMRVHALGAGSRKGIKLWSEVMPCGRYRVGRDS